MVVLTGLLKIGSVRVAADSVMVDQILAEEGIVLEVNGSEVVIQGFAGEAMD